MADTITTDALAGLNAHYARTIDDDRLEEWPLLFLPDCLYRITTADNHRRKLEAGLIYADSRGMLIDRVASLRKANVYERHCYRHVIGVPAMIEQRPGEVACEASFLVVRTMRDGAMSLFAAGRYLDRVQAGSDGTLRFAERLVVLDGCNIDTMLAIPL